MELYTLEKCCELLKDFDISGIQSMEMIDSSHGEEDIRYNYILDKKYVLRVNSANIFSEERFHELNALIQRYQDYGINAPLFLKDKYGVVLHEEDNIYYYVSEYLDGIIPPEDLSGKESATLVYERIKLISGFAKKYKNIQLSSVVSMYSLFDLSPYDQITGIDEKQDNLNTLLQALRECGEEETANKVEQLNRNLREKLLQYYPRLPRCVFQGDENWQNVIVDSDYHITGLFDFNMSGTEVIVNYFANNALLEPSCISDDFNKYSAKQLYRKTLADFKTNTQIIKQYYDFSNEEEIAYDLYTNIILLSSWPNVCTFRKALEEKEEISKVIEILELIIDYLNNKEEYFNS